MIRIVTLLLLLLSPVLGLGVLHTASVPSARAQVRADGRFTLKVRFDLLAFLLDEPPTTVADPPMYAVLALPTLDLQSRLDEAKERFRQDLRLMSGPHGGTFDDVSFPTVEEVQEFANTPGSKKLPLMLTASASGRLSSGQRSVSFSFPEALGAVVLTTELPYEEPVSEPVEPGTASTPLALPARKEIDALAAGMHPRAPGSAPERPTARVQAQKSVPTAVPSKTLPKQHQDSPSTKVQKLSPEPPPNPVDQPMQAPSLATTPSTGPSWIQTFPKYLKMGFLHILPQGLDHILFVVGLFLLSTRTKDLLKQVTAFTVAHSLTLALSLFGVLRLPSNVVEPLIALSIVFIAVENLCTSELKPWRTAVVFGFGLVHGLGFAGALTDAGLAKRDFLSALIGFNAGVELGQLSVVAIAFAAFGWYRSQENYRARIVIPASALIAAVALIWTVQRTLLNF